MPDTFVIDSGAAGPASARTGAARPVMTAEPCSATFYIWFRRRARLDISASLRSGAASSAPLAKNSGRNRLSSRFGESVTTSMTSRRSPNLSREG
jgi:hypothetical protein